MSDMRVCGHPSTTSGLCSICNPLGIIASINLGIEQAKRNEGTFLTDADLSDSPAVPEGGDVPVVTNLERAYAALVASQITIGSEPWESDRRRYAEARKALTDHIAALESEVSRLTRERDEARAECDRMRGDLLALEEARFCLNQGFDHMSSFAQSFGEKCRRLAALPSEETPK